MEKLRRALKSGDLIATHIAGHLDVIFQPRAFRANACITPTCTRISDRRINFRVAAKRMLCLLIVPILAHPPVPLGSCSGSLNIGPSLVTRSPQTLQLLQHLVLQDIFHCAASRYSEKVGSKFSVARGFCRQGRENPSPKSSWGQEWLNLENQIKVSLIIVAYVVKIGSFPVIHEKILYELALE